MEPGARQLRARRFLPHNRRTTRFSICLNHSPTTCFQPILSHSTGGIRQQFSATSAPGRLCFLRCLLLNPKKITKRTHFPAVLRTSVKLQTIAFQVPLPRCQPIPPYSGGYHIHLSDGGLWGPRVSRKYHENQLQSCPIVPNRGGYALPNSSPGVWHSPRSGFRVPCWPKIPVAITPFFDSLLGLSGSAGEGNGPWPPSREGRLVLRSGCCEGGGHNNTEINPVFRGMSQVKSRDLNQRKYCD